MFRDKKLKHDGTLTQIISVIANGTKNIYKNPDGTVTTLKFWKAPGCSLYCQSIELGPRIKIWRNKSLFS